MQIKVGDVVLLPEFGGSSVKLAEDKELFVYRDDDILGLLEEKLAQWNINYSFVFLKKFQKGKENDEI